MFILCFLLWICKRMFSQASSYPLILSLENHCSVEQQTVMARHLSAVLGEKLLTKSLSDLNPHVLPSPEVQRFCSIVEKRNVIFLNVILPDFLLWNFNPLISRFLNNIQLYLSISIDITSVKFYTRSTNVA